MTYVRNLFVCTLLLAFAGAAFGQQKGLDPKYLRNGPAVAVAFKPVVAKPSESTVRVAVDGRDVALGAVVDADGWIITKMSEVKNLGDITCKFKNGIVLEAKLVNVDEEFDLAMLKVPARGLKPVEWRPSKEVTVGKWVASVGPSDTPIGIGVVSVARRLYKFLDQPPKVMLSPTAGYMGVGLEPGPGGARVTKVEPKSPADRAELKINDIIYEAAGRKIIDHETLINTVQRLKAGDKVLLKFKRGEEDKETTVTLGKLPKSLRGNPQETMGAKLSRRRGGFPAIIQHDSGLRPEDQGGPLVDLDGKTVGINISRAGRTETYAIPADDVLPLLPKLKTERPVVANPEGEPLRVTGKLSAKDELSKARKGRHMKVHEVKLAAGETVVVEMKSAEFDPYVIVEDAKGAKLAEKGTGFATVRLEFRAPAEGTYRIVATTFSADETGAYTLTVRRQGNQ